MLNNWKCQQADVFPCCQDSYHIMWETHARELFAMLHESGNDGHHDRHAMAVYHNKDPGIIVEHLPGEISKNSSSPVFGVRSRKLRAVGVPSQLDALQDELHDIVCLSAGTILKRCTFSPLVAMTIDRFIHCCTEYRH